MNHQRKTRFLAGVSHANGVAGPFQAEWSGFLRVPNHCEAFLGGENNTSSRGRRKRAVRGWQHHEVSIFFMHNI